METITSQEGRNHALPRRLTDRDVLKKVRGLTVASAPNCLKALANACNETGYLICGWPDGVLVAIKPPFSATTLIAAYQIGRLSLEREYAEGYA